MEVGAGSTMVAGTGLEVGAGGGVVLVRFGAGEVVPGRTWNKIANFELSVFISRIMCVFYPACSLEGTLTCSGRGCVPSSAGGADTWG